MSETNHHDTIAALGAEIAFGLDDIDEQHGELISALKRLEEGSDRSEEEAAEALEAFLQFAASYFLFHSFTEEKLMFDHGYPLDDYFAHVKEHKEVLLELITLRDGGRSPRFGIVGGDNRERAARLASWFRDEWLERHIREHDGRLIEFLRKKGL